MDEELGEEIRVTYQDLVNVYGKEQVDKEIDLELSSKEEAYNSFMSKRRGNSDRNAPPRGTLKVLIQESIPVFAKAIKGFFDKANTGLAGKRHIVFGLVRNLEPEIIAFVTLRTVLAKCIEHNSLTGLAADVGDAVEKELRYKQVLNSMESREKSFFKEGLSKRVAFSYKYQYLARKERLMAEEGKIDRWAKYTGQQKTQIGLKLIELLIISTGIIKLYREVGKLNRPVYKIKIDEDIVNYIDRNDEEYASLLFIHQPMVIPPLPWSTIDDGGYLLNLKSPIRLVRCPRKTCERVYGSVDMPSVYKAVNAIQSTAWRVNKRVYEVASEIGSWRHIPEGLEMPLAEPAEPPIRPEEANTNPLVQKEWRHQMVSYYQAENVRRGKRYLINAMLGCAKKYLEEPKIYFPHNLDFRGRIYPLTTFSPQGNDLTKSLIEFADGVPLGDNGHTWLAIQGANMFGLDKKPFSERLEWVYSNSELINKVAENPLENLTWTEADEPWEFLAFCFEWSEYLKVGTGEFVSHLPVAFDGSCSGLQHFSAMLMDSVGGSAVNLCPDAKVNDIYNIVAKKVIEILKKDLEEGTIDTIEKDEEAEEGEEGGEYIKKGTKSLAKEWLDYGITRKVTKRPTMTLCYGACQYGFGEQILEDTIYPALSKNPIAFSKPRQAARYLAEKIWEALGSTVIKAVEAMAWLQETSTLLANDKNIKGERMPTFWVTPAGFPVLQKYYKKKMVMIKTFVAGNLAVYDCFKNAEEVIDEGHIVVVSYRKDTEELDTRKQKNGIAPNFVHSMDASHLMLTICKCFDLGLRNFAMIHDSYGCSAGQGSIMFNTVREIFVETYKNNDVLQDLHDHVELLLSPKMAKKLTQPPTKGDLDIDKVKESLYAFS